MEEQDKDKDSQEINYFPQDPDSNQILLHTNNRTIKPVESQLITQQTLNQQVQSNQQQDIQKAQVDSFNYNIFNQKAYNQDNANQADHQFSVMHQSFLTSGRGTFGIVQIIADFQSGQLRAQKQFQLLEHYQKEAQIYKNMNNDFGDEQRELLALSIQPDEYNEQKQTIYFQPGVCSLQQLLDEPNFQLTTDQAVHVFITLLEFILLMKEKGYCHSDIKPNNTQLVRAGKNTGQFVLKVIDFGALTKEKLQYTAFTREFFNNPKRNYDQQGYVIFNNMEERFKNEFYTVIRTMQSMLLGNADKPIFKLENYQDQEIKLQNLKQIQQIINEKYQNQQQHNINDILTFITDQGLEEQYSFQDLQIILQRLKTNLTIEQKYFHDTQNTIRNIMDKQLIRINQRTDPIALLFGVNNYIYQMGSYSELHTNQFNLIDHFKQKFQELAVHKRSIVIIGESGAGKTLLLIKLRKELQQLENNYDIILINLKDLSDTNQDQQQKNQNLYDKISIYIKQQQKSKNNKNLIVLLDGYDELNDKQLNIHHQIIDNFKEYNQINIIVTMRPDYVNDTQLEQIFNKPIKIYICPFNKTQREEYVANFKKQFKKYKEFMLHSETLQTDNDYMQILEQSQQLDQLCARPFTLSLVVFMIPTLKQKMTEKKNLANKIQDIQNICQ